MAGFCTVHCFKFTYAALANNLSPQIGSTPLHSAAKRDYKEEVSALLANGANINAECTAVNKAIAMLSVLCFH
jgi:ankyrin repeat protein